MSINAPHRKEGTGPTTEQFEFAAATDTKINVRNHSHETPTTYTVSITTDGGRAMSCTCPDYKYRHSGTVGGQCKHMAAVEANLEDIRSDAPNPRSEERITGPHSAYAPTPYPEEFDHYTYWRCEHCGAECDEKRALEDCCQ